MFPGARDGAGDVRRQVQALAHTSLIHRSYAFTARYRTALNSRHRAGQRGQRLLIVSACAANAQALCSVDKHNLTMHAECAPHGMSIPRYNNLL